MSQSTTFQTGYVTRVCKDGLAPKDVYMSMQSGFCPWLWPWPWSIFTQMSSETLSQKCDPLIICKKQIFSGRKNWLSARRRKKVWQLEKCVCVWCSQPTLMWNVCLRLLDVSYFTNEPHKKPNPAKPSGWGTKMICYWSQELKIWSWPCQLSQVSVVNKQSLLYPCVGIELKNEPRNTLFQRNRIY